tara:strand:- start:947 stop:1948 length:1002 start_codon:yes stop_codon:yes gene_type:complete
MEKRFFNSDEILLTIKFNWIKIFYSTVIFSVIGVIIGFTTPFEYTASTKLLPKTSNSSTSSIGGLANLTGFNLLSGLGSDETIPAQLFPEISESITYKIRIANSNIDFGNGRISVREYILNNYFELNFDPNFNYYYNNENIYTLSTIEKDLHRLISNIISIDVDERKGLVSIYSTSKHAEVSSQLTTIASSNLQDFIIDFQTKKAKDELIFLKERKEEIHKDREKKKDDLISFEDENLNLVTNKSIRALEDLKNEFNLIDEVFKQISQELESQKIKVKKQTPVFSVIEPVSIPNQRSKPIRSRILRLWFAFGLIGGVLFVIIRHLLKKFLNNG